MDFIGEISVQAGFDNKTIYHNGIVFKLGKFGIDDYPTVMVNPSQNLNLDQLNFESEGQTLQLNLGRRNLKQVITLDEKYQDWKFELGITGNYAPDKNEISGNVVEIVAVDPIENEANPNIWIAWVGSIQGSTGIFVDELEWEF